MTTALMTARLNSSLRRAPVSPAGGKCNHGLADDAKGMIAGAGGEQPHLAVVVTQAAEFDEPGFEEWQAELALVESSRALPLAWPLREWLEDYCDILVTALRGRAGTRQHAPAAARGTAEICDFLQLMLSGGDRQAAEFIRSSARLPPFADEMQRLRRVQALFALIRPARSLAEALGFRIVTQRGGIGLP
jgi:hypothetical protein